MLSERERQLLADIEAELQAGDPDLARRLAPPQEPRRHRLLGWSLIVGGFVLVLATLAWSLPVAILGLGLTAAGMMVIAGHMDGRLIARTEWSPKPVRRDATPGTEEV